MADVTPTVVTVDDQEDVELELSRWQTLTESALVSSGVAEGELNLIFIGEPKMTDLNRVHMGEDRPTDVLSFPLDGAESDGLGDALIGDIVICPAYAARQAGDHVGEAGHDGSVDDELALLIVHGVLHIVGHDHAEPGETAAMKAEEARLLDAHHRADRS